MWRINQLFAKSLLGLVLTASCVLAEDAPALLLEKTQGELAAATAQKAKLTETIAAASAEQEANAQKLIGLAASLAAQLEKRAEAADRQLALGEELLKIRADLAQRREELSNLLAGLQLLEHNPPPAFIVKPGDILGALRGAMMFGAVVPGLSAKAKYLGEKLQRLHVLETEQNLQEQTAAAEILALNSARLALLEANAEKQSLQKQTQAELEVIATRQDLLAKEAQNLQQLLARLEEDRQRQEAQKSVEALAEAAEKQRQIDAAARPLVLFHDLQGKLDFPVQGQISHIFGDDNGLGGRLEGLAILTATGSLVRTPVDGKVEFAGQFRSYGDLVIINPGDDYLVLLAGMARILPKSGQFLRAGEPVGEMGTGQTSLALIGSDRSDNKTILYVELRKNGHPIDSAPWWLNGSKEAKR
jgi:murein hydrolase activator